jgi:hypothetical protein
MSSPAVSFLADNRNSGGGDIMKIGTVAAIGEARLSEDKEFSSLKLLLIRKFPDLGSFLVSGETAIVKIKVRKYILVSRFQEAAVLEMT